MGYIHQKPLFTAKLALGRTLGFEHRLVCDFRHFDKSGSYRLLADPARVGSNALPQRPA